jgi:hypothetical protein
VACEPPLSICRLQWFDLTDCVPLADREEQYRARLPYLLRAVEQGHAAPLLTPSGRDLDPLTGLLALAAPTDRFVGIPEAPGATVPRRLPAAFPVGTPIRLMVHADAGCHFLLLNVSASGGVGCVCPSWLAPDPRLHPGANPFPQPSSAYRAFPLDEPGREVLLGVLSDRPLPLDLMPPDQQTPAAVLGPRQIDRLAAELRAMDRHEWEAVVTYIDVEPGPGAG